MTYPTGWDLVTITGTYVGRNGAPCVGSVTLSSPQLVLRSGTIVPAADIVFTLDANGSFTGQIPATDDPNANPSGWVYTVTENMPGGRQGYLISAPHTSPGIDLSTVIPIGMPMPPTFGFPYVTLAQLAAESFPTGASLVGFLATGTGAIGETVQAKLAQLPSVLDYGADPTGATTSVAAFNAALTANDAVTVPPGTYLIDDAVTVGLQKALIGYDRRSCIIHMPSTFNGSALGALVFNGGEPGPTISGLTFIQDQPDSVTPTVYPPVIYAQACPRFNINQCRIALVYDAIDMRGNSGGAQINDLELSSLHIGIDIDGCLDVVRIHKLHYWPFAGAGNGTMTSNQRVAMQAATGIKSARCDGLQMVNCLFLGSRNELYLYSSTSGTTFGAITTSDFDSNGGFVMSAGQFYITNCTFSLGDSGSNYAAITGGEALFNNCYFTWSASPTANGYITTSGQTMLSNCYFHQSSDDKTVIYASGGDLVLTGNFISKASGTYTQPLVHGVGSVSGSASGNFMTPTSSGTWISLDTDTGFTVVGNTSPGWGIHLPSGTAPNTLMAWNGGGSKANGDDYAGYFSSDGTTTVKLPSGWSVSRLGTGNYSLTHSLGLTNVIDLLADLSVDDAANGASAQLDLTNSTTNAARIRTNVGATATDCGVFFRFKRYRG